MFEPIQKLIFVLAHSLLEKCLRWELNSKYSRIKKAINLRGDINDYTIGMYHISNC